MKRTVLSKPTPPTTVESPELRDVESVIRDASVFGGFIDDVSIQIWDEENPKKVYRRLWYSIEDDGRLIIFYSDESTKNWSVFAPSKDTKGKIELVDTEGCSRWLDGRFLAEPEVGIAVAASFLKDERITLDERWEKLPRDFVQ